MIRAAVVGYGNIGKFAVDAVMEAPDFELAGIVRRRVGGDLRLPDGVVETDDISKLGRVNAVILCTPTRNSREYAEKYLKMGINTVDSYDAHSSIYDLKISLDSVARDSGAVAIISAGWDPGTDSVVRALMSACAPKGTTHTNFGPGMSMGHTVAAKSISGVKEAISITIPLGTGVHRRIVYVETEEGADIKEIGAKLKNDPYFAHDETRVIEVDCVKELLDMGHGVNMVRQGVSGRTHNQRFEFNMSINNPALTSQIMVAYARASMKAAPGAYTPIEIPPIDLLYGGREQIIRALV